MKIDDLTWFLTIGSLIGGQLIIYKNKVGYAIWIVVNILWMIFFFSKGIYSSSFLFLVYLIQSIYGYLKWNQKK
ncbi:MAG: nicotinamide mononucleotide transporter [Burkholderiales bacterium]|nr:nicotinamide mononucleotide transporter [Burkholderiales bacterium]